MKRKSCRNGFITALPRHSLQKSPSQHENELINLRQNVKNIINRLPHGTITNNAIYHSGLSHSGLFNCLTKRQMPTNLHELKKMKENLMVVEKQVQKLKWGKKRQSSEESENRKVKKRRKLEQYKKWKQERRNIFNEDEYMRLQIVKELNYRKKMQKFMRTDHVQNKKQVVKAAVDRMHKINNKVLEIYDKQKEKEKNSYDHAMTLFRNRTQQMEDKKEKIRTINTSGHERKFVRIAEYKNSSLKIGGKEERKKTTKSMDEKSIKEKWMRKKEKMEQTNVRRQQIEEKQFQSKIRRAIETKNKIQKFHIDGIKVEKKKKQGKRVQPDLQDRLDELQRKIFESVDERVKRKEEYLFNKTEMVKERIQRQKTRILMKKEVLSRQNNEKYDKVYASATAIKKRKFANEIEEKIREKHSCVLARSKFEKRALNLRSQSTSCLIKKLAQLQNKQKKHRKEFNFR